jgi:glycosyltransferase involved in cell wall biosynthesis
VAVRTVAALPAFNEERAIAKVIVHARKHVDKVLVLDDGSTDDTALIAESLGATVIRHEKNMGKGAALRDCFEWARVSGANVLVTLDADGQHDPEQIPALLAVMQSGEADVVIGSRTSKPSDMPRHRWVGASALNIATQVKVDDRYVDAQSGFRAYSRRAIENLIATESGMGVDSETLMRAHDAGLKIVEVPVNTRYAGLETSSKNSMAHGLNVFFSIIKFVSIRHPLTFYGGFGLVALTISFVFGLQTLDYYQRWGRVVTNLALVSVAAGFLGFLGLFTGIILFTLITLVREQKR